MLQNHQRGTLTVIANPHQKVKSTVRKIQQELTKVNRRRQSIIFFRHDRELIKTPVRSLKIQPFYRESRSRNIFWSKPARIVPKILLCGNWLMETGFRCSQRISVITMDQMLIIIPEPDSGGNVAD